MDPREMETLVQRLVQNPHDQEAITYAHQSGQADPRSYAMLLEKVGTATSDPAFASHWLTEAAKVWSTSLADAHRAARALMAAVDKDPTQPLAAERLAELYREKGDSKALVALLDRRAKALAPLAEHDLALRHQAASIHEELGRLWSDAPLNQPKRAMENYRRAIEYDSRSQYSIYALRELYKAHRQWTDAVPLFELELRLVDDLERRTALFCDEAEVRRLAGDLEGATRAYRSAREVEGGQDAALRQLLAALVLQRVQQALEVEPVELAEGAELFVQLAEEYPGEHGFSYSLCALELAPTHDRAMQLAIYYGEQLGRAIEAAPRAAAYLKGNPSGALAAEARGVVTQAMELGGDDSLLEALGPAPGAFGAERVRSLLEVALALARKAKKNEAAAKYQEVLALDPGNADAIAFLEGYYRQTRKFAELREMLLGAARSPGADADQRGIWLKEVAVLSESQLRDPIFAIGALKEAVTLDPDDETARNQLKRLLEKAGQWDELAVVLTEEAEQFGDLEARILLERSLAKLHEQRRKDPIAAGETWARIAALAPNDEEAIWTAISHFEAAERQDLAARVIADNLAMILEPATRSPLLEKLGDLRLALNEPLGAGEAYAEGASLVKSAELWSAAEKAFVRAVAWDQAATAVDERAQIASSNTEKAELYGTEADYLSRAGDASNSVMRLEQAADLDPENQGYASRLEESYERSGRTQDLAAFLLRRADNLNDRTLRVELRKRAAHLHQDALSDADGARSTFSTLLEDGDDPEALVWLASDAEQSGDPRAAVGYLARLEKVTRDPVERIQVTLREAALLADGLDDLKGALARYKWILDELDPKHVGVLERIADLEDRLDNPKATADALERRLSLLEAGAEKLSTAERLARLYEGPLDQPKAAIRVLDVVREIEPEDYDAVQRLCELCERVEDWPRVAELLASLIELEGDEEDVSRMTRRLATILHQKVARGDDALAALMRIGDLGDQACREEYVRLGDELGWKGVVASKLVEWYVDAAAGPERNQALRGAFDRFLAVGRDADAANVAKELVRTRGADRELAERLETIAVKLKDLDALAIAHDLIAQELTGLVRAEELVRQAEVLSQAGVEPLEAVQHGEQSLSSVPPSEVWPLLDRLVKLGIGSQAVVDCYERQVTRCKVPSDRLAALARAAQVAAAHDALDRARQFLDLALGGNIQEETLEMLDRAARENDQARGGDHLRRTLAEALSSGGQGSRDGGKTRSALLGRAARIAHRDLGDTARAFVWLGDAIVAHVGDDGLDALEVLAAEIGEPRRVEEVLSRALEEVYDGPLVRKLLARRALLRSQKLQDPGGAAADLKRLHDLAPSDTSVMGQLSLLYTELKNYRGMVELYEDQILRGKDPLLRAELARKVARLWEKELDDARESADAWRRVLRMKAGDSEASEGLERAKSNMLKKRPERETPSDAFSSVPAPLPMQAISAPVQDDGPPSQPERSTVVSIEPTVTLDSWSAPGSVTAEPEAAPAEPEAAPAEPEAAPAEPEAAPAEPEAAPAEPEARAKPGVQGVPQVPPSAAEIVSEATEPARVGPKALEPDQAALVVEPAQAPPPVEVSVEPEKSMPQPPSRRRSPPAKPGRRPAPPLAPPPAPGSAAAAPPTRARSEAKPAVPPAPVDETNDEVELDVDEADLIVDDDTA